MIWFLGLLLVVPAWAQPTVKEIQTDEEAVNSNTLTLAYADLVSGLSAGDLALLIVAADSNVGAVTGPGGSWSELHNGTATATCGVWGLDATGSESGTETISIASGGEQWAAFWVTINSSSWGGTLGTHVDISTGAVGTSTTPDPDQVTMGSGAGPNYLVITAMCSDDDETVSAYPETGNNNAHVSNTGSGTTTVAISTTTTTAGTYDPSTYTIGNEAWRALTIAIEEASSGNTSLRRRRN